MYKDKYLKYKSKYINLKIKQTGGANNKYADIIEFIKVSPIDKIQKELRKLLYDNETYCDKVINLPKDTSEQTQ